MKFRIILYLSLAFIFGSCASTPKHCQEADWYELGRRDGATGKPIDYAQHRRMCLKSDLTLNEDLYHNGRHAGLLEYCTSDNAFEMGKSGQTYQFVCPANLEDAFLARYRQGQSVFRLQTANASLQDKIRTLEVEIKFSRSERREAINAELSELRQNRSRNDQELSRLGRRL
jgi:hypothetical protein